MKVFTFYDPLPGHPNFWPLTEFWANSWRKRGWQTQVLSLAEARAHARFQELVQAVDRRSFPSLCGIDYDKRCFARWLALAACGGGLLTNYSVINYGLQSPVADWTGLKYFNGTTSPMIFVDRLWSAKLANVIVDFVQTWPRAEESQDMHCLTQYCWHGCKEATLVPGVLVEFPVRGADVWGGRAQRTDWQTSPVVHYPRGTAGLVSGNERNWVGTLQSLRAV